MLKIPIVDDRAILEVNISRSAAQAILMVEQTHSGPSEATVAMLIDTGATHTCIDFRVAELLGLHQADTVENHTASSGQEPMLAPRYLAQLSIAFPGRLLTIGLLPVTGLDLSAQGIDGLLGMDVLGGLYTLVNGPQGQLCLSLEPLVVASPAKSGRSRRRPS